MKNTSFLFAFFLLTFSFLNAQVVSTYVTYGSGYSESSRSQQSCNSNRGNSYSDPYDNRSNSRYDDRYDDQDEGEYGNDRHHHHHQQGQGTRNNPRHARHPRHSRHHEPAYVEPVIYPMDRNEFASAMHTLDAQNFESTRMNVAKQILQYNYVTSMQVREMMGLFSFESTRLKFAKFCYAKVVDPNRYYLINDGFSFSSSVNEMSRFTAGR